MPEQADRTRTIFLTGATGFVGSYLCPALEAAGFAVRCATRDPEKAGARHPGREWIHVDVERVETVAPALADSWAAFYLIHAMNEGGDFPGRERRCAENFAQAAAEVRLGRIVYLGGTSSTGPASRHLASRHLTGTILRSGQVPTVELRAAMVIGVGSASWTMIRHFASRSSDSRPAWMQSSSFPVAIDDTVIALLGALAHGPGPSSCFEIPGAERVSYQHIADLVAREVDALGLPSAAPTSGVNRELARELGNSARSDFEPQGETFWARIGHVPMAMGQAVRLALQDERSSGIPARSALPRLRAIGARFRRGGAPQP